MTTQINNDFANRELSIDELDTIAGGDWLGTFINFLEGDHGYLGERARHQSFWDSDALCDALAQANFVDVQQLQHQCGETPDLPMIETHTPIGALYVEARKPQ